MLYVNYISLKLEGKMYMYRYKYIYSVYISICQDFHCVLLGRFHKIKGIVSYQDVALGKKYSFIIHHRKSWNNFPSVFYFINSKRHLDFWTFNWVFESNCWKIIVYYLVLFFDQVHQIDFFANLKYEYINSHIVLTGND